MSELPRRCRRSEIRTLPRFRCEHCGSSLQPKPDLKLGFGDTGPDPEVALSFECPRPLCPNNGPGF